MPLVLISSPLYRLTPFRVSEGSCQKYVLDVEIFLFSLLESLACWSPLSEYASRSKCLGRAHWLSSGWIAWLFNASDYLWGLGVGLNYRRTGLLRVHRCLCLLLKSWLNLLKDEPLKSLSVSEPSSSPPISLVDYYANQSKEIWGECP